MIKGQVPAQTFIGRSSSLESLERAFHRPEGELVLVYGRRRIGKSFLLERFTEGKPTIFFQATQLAKGEELAEFTRIVRETFGSEHLPPGYVFSTWEEALNFLAERDTHERLIVVLDEFPFLAEVTPGLASLIQRWWDKRGRLSHIMLILCGSAQAFMRDLENASAPLHQRFTTRLHVGPLSYHEAAQFTPNLSAEDKARVYGIAGGTPLYLRQWNEQKTFRENLSDLFAHPGNLLVDSAEFVMSTDLQDLNAPFRILQAVATGSTKHNEVRTKAGITTDRAIYRLVELNLLRKRIPATDDPLRSRRSIYTVAEPYFRFFFRFLVMNRGAIERGFGEQVIDEQIVPFFEDYMGGIFEEIARDFARTLVLQGTLRADDVGSWWSTNGQHEIDIVGTARRVPTFVGSVKWRKPPLDRHVLRDLERDIQAFGVKNVERLLIGRGGALSELIEPGLRAYSIEDVYAM